MSLSELTSAGGNSISQPISTTPFPPRYWWLKRLSIAGGAWLVFLVALRLWWGWEADRRFEAEVARIQAAREPIFPEDFDSRPIPDERNAVTLLLQALNAMNVSAQDDRHLDDWSYGWGKVQNERGDIEPILAANATALDLLHQAAQRTDVDWDVRIRSPAINFVLPNLSASRQLGKLCISAANYEHVNRHDERAIQRMHDAFHHARIVDQQSTFLTHLTALSLQALVCSSVERTGPTLRLDSANPGDPQAATRTAVQNLIADLLDEDAYSMAFVRSMYTERMWQFDTLQSLKQGTSSLRALTGGPTPSLWAAGAILNIPIRPLLTYDGLNCLQNTSDYADAAKQGSWPAARKRFPGMSSDDSPWNQVMHPFSRIIMPSFERSFVLHYRLLADRRMAALVLALRLCESDHGARPRSLVDLVPTYISELPADPFDAAGSPICYQPDIAKPILYSIGLDGIDNGGAFAFHSTGGIKVDQLDQPFFLDGKRPTSATDLNHPPETSPSGEEDHDDQTDAERQTNQDDQRK